MYTDIHICLDAMPCRLQHPGLDVHQHLPAVDGAAAPSSGASGVAGAAEALRADEGQDTWQGWISMGSPWDLRGICEKHMRFMGNLWDLRM